MNCSSEISFDGNSSFGTVSDLPTQERKDCYSLSFVWFMISSTLLFASLDTNVSF
jgi:hypothetical protein